jgi:microcystin-dependent protein
VSQLLRQLQDALTAACPPDLISAGEKVRSSWARILGEEAHTVSVAELPAHSHEVDASSTAAETNVATGAHLAAVNNAYAPPSDLVALAATAVSNAAVRRTSTCSRS